jgi:hypothetical protein
MLLNLLGITGFLRFLSSSEPQGTLARVIATAATAGGGGGGIVYYLLEYSCRVPSFPELFKGLQDYCKSQGKGGGQELCMIMREWSYRRGGERN